jgi:hypothetical protein
MDVRKVHLYPELHELDLNKKIKNLLSKTQKVLKNIKIHMHV